MKHDLRSVIWILLAGSLVGCATNSETKTTEKYPGFHPVDLTQHYNKKSDSFAPGSSWSAAPWGERTYDGVPFELGGVLEVTGIDAARNLGDVYHGRYTGMPVENSGAWIHVVHGVGWKEADGMPIARLTLHYKNGRTSTMVIKYGVNVRNWWVESSEVDSRLADIDSRQIWSAPNPENVGRPVTLRLYKSSFPNPHPSWIVSTIDIESLFSHATPAVLAVTIGKAGYGVRWQPPSATRIPYHFVSTAVIRASDTGKPITGANVRMELSDGERTYPFGEQITDSKGSTVFDFSRAQSSKLNLSISAPGYETLSYTRNILDLPGQLELKLNPKSS